MLPNTLSPDPIGEAEFLIFSYRSKDAIIKQKIREKLTMPSPFPGMNPYLENTAYWPSIHHWLINQIARSLNPQLRPNYVVAVEVRMYETATQESTLVGIPDNVVVKNNETANLATDSSVAVAAPPAQPITITVPIPQTVKQGYLEVKEVGTGEVITVIEVLSPINKLAIKGRVQYENKRLKVFGSSTHLVEIDLLRKGKPLVSFNNGMKSDYRILVSRKKMRPKADLYTFNLQDKIPNFSLPLRDGDTEPVIDLQNMLNEIYDGGSYDLMVDYNKEPIPSLSKTDRVLADNLLRQKGLR